MVYDTDAGLQGYNLFAYCGGNPVNRIDISGTDSERLDDLDLDDDEVTERGGGGQGNRGHYRSGSGGYGGSGSGTGSMVGDISYISTKPNLPDIGGPDYAMDFAYTESQCFAAGTLVQTADGPVPIEDIAVGTMVWAWDEVTGAVTLKEVVETYVSETDELVHIYVNSEEIVCTPSHPFYSPVKGWTDAVKLRAGDILVLVNGEHVVVEKVQHEILEAPVTVYNFQVEDFHTYHVANTGVLVHNKCQPTSPNQMQQQVASGKAPKEVLRVDKAAPGSNMHQPHVHFRDGTVLNMDGTTSHSGNGIPRLTAEIIEWLTKNGWGVPK